MRKGAMCEGALELPLVWRYYNVLAPLLRASIRRNFGHALAERAYHGGRARYRALMGEAPRIGADNPMASNIYEAFVFLALYQAAEGELTPRMLRVCVADLFDHLPSRLIGRVIDLRRPSCMRWLNEYLHTSAAWAEAHPEVKDVTWDFAFGDERGGTVACYHFTHCPINDFCQTHGLADALPAVCAIDHMTARLAHGHLTREFTLAEGGPVCDYLIEPACDGAEPVTEDVALTPDEGRKAEIKAAYRGVGRTHGFYDGQMLGTTRSGRWMQRHVWGMGPDDALEYQARAFEAIPADFAGSLLEVPVGTGVLSLPVFQTLPKARITCLDYSPDMLSAARERAAEMGVTHVDFVQGDVGALPFADESFDAVVSLNGFHAFPDKEAAWAETFRVLKAGGTFCGCFYVEGANERTDRIISGLYVPLGFFTPPFETKQSLTERLTSMYEQVEVACVQSIATFRCVKGEAETVG